MTELFNITMPEFDAKTKAMSVAMPKAFDRGLEAGIKAATIHLSSEIKTLIEGPVLNRVTGRLWRSIHPETFRQHGTTIGVVGTNVVYAAIHEFGGMAGRGRSVKIPKRPYVSRAFREQREKVADLIHEYVNAALEDTLSSGGVLPASERLGVSK